MYNKIDFMISKKIIVCLIICAIVTVHGCTPHTQQETMTLIVFTAHRCESCIEAEDNIDFIKRNFPEIQIKTIEIYGTEGLQYVTRYKIWRVPVYLLIDSDSRELFRLEGKQSRDQLKKAIEAAKSAMQRL